MGETPAVTVITPVHNAARYLKQCVDSVLDQTIGIGELEIILVDDGSTDGSGELIDDYARRYPGVVRVFHHDEPSGGPGRPRNTALDLGPRGEYVFFLDADDWLGDEALERLVAAARRWGSDVVLAKMVGVGGYPVPVTMFRHDQPRADLFTSRVYWSLSACKLWRRELIAGLRFPHHYGEDQLFSTRAYLAAETISVLASYDCLYLRGREDGGNMTAGPVDQVARVGHYDEICELITSSVPPGEGRNFMIYRNLVHGPLGRFGDRYLAQSREEKERLVEAVAASLGRWLDDGIRARMSPYHRLRAYCVEHRLLGLLDEIVAARNVPVRAEHDRLFQLYPGFREAGVPDTCYDATRAIPLWRRLTSLDWTADGRLAVGWEAGLTGVAADDVRLTLTERETGEILEPGPGPLDPARLTPGVWDVSVAVRVAAVERTGRLGADRDHERTEVPPPRLAAGHVAQPYYTDPYGNLSIDVGERVFPLARAVRLTRVTPDAAGRLAVEWEVTFGRRPAPAGAVRALVWRREGDGARVRAEAAEPGSAAVEFPGPGVWHAYAEVALGEETRLVRAGERRAAGKATRPPAYKTRAGARRCVARTGYDDGGLSVSVEPLLRARLRKLVRTILR
ncbi:glycosyltransferase [Bailinhaonella thermotolerans]|uniref:Glycosyltransferase n=1 Tax=Bailinhaonella thermotolerans TaxID=1070861 RepID=A0A3A4BHS3_9ACTN|nr:glycosyltransferase [Bailinhaonella thermotolerans]RJL30812.1 glycosyltransferase [Bailinhaonella thermotolerans]